MSVSARFSLAAEAPSIQSSPIAFDQLDGWGEQDHSAAFQAFVRSCTKLRSRASAIDSIIDMPSWQRVCEKAQYMQALSAATSQQFFEAHFQPYRLSAGGDAEGLLTGYYIPQLNGSRIKTDHYNTPAYKKPNDAHLAALSRAEIASGALAGKGLELVYLNAVDLFFTQVQGSGRIQLDSGEVVDLLFAAKNGQPYTAIGRTLMDMGELDNNNVSLQSIRAWLLSHPRQAQQVMNSNASYVFFSLGDAKQMPSGAQGVPLTTEASMAIDPTQTPYGLPVFIQTKINPYGQTLESFNRLFVTQDTGTAIKGPLRGDLFFGQGKRAEQLAGNQKFRGGWAVLIPKRSH